MSIQTYEHKPRHIRAIQITRENADDIIELLSTVALTLPEPDKIREYLKERPGYQVAIRVFPKKGDKSFVIYAEDFFIIQGDRYSSEFVLKPVPRDVFLSEYRLVE